MPAPPRLARASDATAAGLSQLQRACHLESQRERNRYFQARHEDHLADGHDNRREGPALEAKRDTDAREADFDSALGPAGVRKWAEASPGRPAVEVDRAIVQ